MKREWTEVCAGPTRLLIALTVLWLTTGGALGQRGRITPAEWRPDVSHATIPKHPARGVVGESEFTATRALLHTALDPADKPKDVKFYTLELTSDQGTPGMEFVLTVQPGSQLDGKTLWQKSSSRRPFNSHSPGVTVGKGEESVSYPPFQEVWLHGKRKPQFQRLKVYGMKVVETYTARIEFGTAQGSSLPGRIYFCGEADPHWKAPRSVIAGSFTAKILPVGR